MFGELDRSVRRFFKRSARSVHLPPVQVLASSGFEQVLEIVFDDESVRRSAGPLSEVLADRLSTFVFGRQVADDAGFTGSKHLLEGSE